MNANTEAVLPMMTARERLAALGWIPPRSEYFHHLPPPAAEVWLGDAADAARAIAPVAAHDGWQVTLHGDTAQDAVDVQWLDATNPAQRKTLFAGTPEPGANDQDRFVWAHRALAQRGLRLHVRGNGTPVQLAVHRSAVARVEAPTLVIDVAPGTQCVVVETHETANTDTLVQNLQLHAHVAEGARLRHIRVVTPAASHQLAHQVHATVGTKARYDQILVANGSTYHHQRSEIILDHTDGQAYTGAALFVSGSSALDQQVEALHGAGQTLSDMETVMLGSGRARGVVNIMTRMAKHVRNARTLQMMRGIPTGGGQPRITLRPHMEICHDAVEAEHGATWGALPEDALFYARQRGLNEQTARALIVQGMLTALLAHVLDDDIDLVASFGLEQHLQTAIAAHLAADAPAAQNTKDAS